MATLIENIGHILSMLILVCMSAFFSGTETAYFNLTRRQIEQLRHSEHKLSNLAAAVATKRRALLSALLFGNMTVNVLYFASSSVLVLRMERQVSVGAAAVTAAASFILLLLCGEIFPKSASFAHSKGISIIAAGPAYLCIKVLRPLVGIFNFLIITPAMRLLVGAEKEPESMTTAEFKSLIEQVGKTGQITEVENKLLSEIAELHLLKVRHCLKPRVDMLACDITESRKNVLKLMRDNDVTRIVVYHEEIDNVRGMVELRDLLIKPQAKVGQVVNKAHYVPEQKTIESLIEHFQVTQTDTAVVVDEYGGIAGTISLEDIAEEILGPIELEETEPVQQIGPLQYRLAANIPVHEWQHSFGIDLTQARYTTIGGLIISLLDRIPKEGDIANLRNLEFKVERVNKNRIVSVILTFKALNEDVQ